MASSGLAPTCSICGLGQQAEACLASSWGRPGLEGAAGAKVTPRTPTSARAGDLKPWNPCMPGRKAFHSEGRLQAVQHLEAKRSWDLDNAAAGFWPHVDM